FNKPTEGANNIEYENGEYMLYSPFEGTYMTMATGEQGEVMKDSLQPLHLRSLYSMAGMQFVLPDPVVKGRYDIVPAEEKTAGLQDAAVVRVTTNGESETLKLMGGQYVVTDPKKIELGGLEIYLRYGSKDIELPFAIQLDDFIANKYPGTESSYSSFESEVTVIDGETTLPYHIYMNHVLDHKGYRFFQSGFDPDEKGTHLSVNHDWWGTWITYIGYTLLYICLVWILFDRGSRFGELRRMLTKVKKKKRKLATVVIAMFLSVTGFAQEQEQVQDEHAHSNSSILIPKTRIDSILLANVVTPEHAAEFGKLVIQDAGGRMKPVNTYASELLRKLSKSDNYEGLTPDQVII